MEVSWKILQYDMRTIWTRLNYTEVSSFCLCVWQNKKTSITELCKVHGLK